MATLKLAEKLRGRDPDRAASLLAGAARYRDDLTEREQLVLALYEERWGKRDMKRIESLVDEYVRRFPKDPEGYKMRADLLANNGRMPEAIAEYEHLIAVNPNYAIAYNTLGYYWAGKGDNAKAEDYLKRYRFLAPNDANPLDSLGELYAFTGRYDEAEENLKKALAVKEDFYAPWGHLGTVEVGRGNPAKAAAYFRKASDNAPSTFSRYDFRFLVAMCLVDAGRVDEAVRELDAASAEIAAMPSGPEARKLKAADAIRRAGLLGRVGRSAEAEASLATADFKELTDPKEPKSQEMAARQLKLIQGVIAMRRRARRRRREAARGNPRGRARQGLRRVGLLPERHLRPPRARELARPTRPWRKRPRRRSSRSWRRTRASSRRCSPWRGRAARSRLNAIASAARAESPS